MKAFKNRKGNILTVFRNDQNKYTVYIQQSDGTFTKYKPNPYPDRNSRFEAETDLFVLVSSSPDKSWTEVAL